MRVLGVSGHGGVVGCGRDAVDVPKEGWGAGERTARRKVAGWAYRSAEETGVETEMGVVGARRGTARHFACSVRGFAAESGEMAADAD
ncbi:hypothetical protein GCM10010168_66880 [Actinoplanes ianthinogenes]|uniref:Uncharacterized protein n=1 Tax=Actinoplanes ianthinogenes TaxID=122358 RepID=A0ABM7LX14_9ACTN|nr:hypothetical protein Aiant_45420 [Actinoplanes ianthinogenes]GGR39025.1 hypothetical protein GCM10010168_66880 [Actinoplanes ianthinogenes]